MPPAIPPMGLLRRGTSRMGFDPYGSLIEKQEVRERAAIDPWRYCDRRTGHATSVQQLSDVIAPALPGAV